jgi:hypothetical protein
MHLNGDKEMNLPFYLLKILTKMSKRIQNYPEAAHRSLYHQGFIKILVLFSLSELGMSWKDFLVSLGLQEEHEIDQNQKSNRLRFPRKLGFPLNLGVHPNPPNEPKKISLPAKRRTDQLKKIHYSRKRGNSSKEIEVIYIETEGKRKW